MDAHDGQELAQVRAVVLTVGVDTQIVEPDGAEADEDLIELVVEGLLLLEEEHLAAYRDEGLAAAGAQRSGQTPHEVLEQDHGVLVRKLGPEIAGRLRVEAAPCGLKLGNEQLNVGSNFISQNLVGLRDDNLSLIHI